METLTWVGIIFCVSQSAMFSGLNLAFFSITNLRLEIESKKGNPTDPFLNQIQSSQKKWVILTDNDDEPKIALNSDGFVRSALFGGPPFNPLRHCHRPIIMRDDDTPLGEVIPKLKVQPEHSDDDVINEDIILIWGSQKRIITGSDILGRLMRGIVQNEGIGFRKLVAKEA